MEIILKRLIKLNLEEPFSTRLKEHFALFRGRVNFWRRNRSAD